ncbi:hypothetical protein [Streptomyces soliscabiei]|uniref:hypothetical protein n=1 Tax=Streptomyces soliscabiei TaxID=588897 RepID=UPI0029A079A5|nr:hypothetical protein [Streptomyces sp. NY05-11A]MDX2683675.1 hypothetical protein [Streptomyces sp. NY05-11A]
MTTRWDPPDPRQLPEWRADMVEHLAAPSTLATMKEAIHAGRCTIVPTVPGMDASPGAVGATILTRCEARRLREAELYYATADMTALALAAAASPPTEPVSLSRLPSEYGLIVFAEPIGGYTEDVGAALAATPFGTPGASAQITTPIVAASWSAWDPSEVQLDQGATVQWTFRSNAASGILPPDYSGIWLTFYSPRGLFSGLAPDTVIGTMADGMVMTAGDIDAHRETHGPQLNWDNEMLLSEGAPFGPPPPDTTQTWAQVIYTAWQLMSQTGQTRWAEVEEVPRPRAGAKRDRRQGITGSSAVRIVRVHATQRPAPQAAREDAQASTGRREPQWSCRWPVRPYRRNTCLNPRGHADGSCRHEDRIVPGHIKGPEGAPLRTGSTVHLWDRQPDEGAGLSG